MVIVLADFLTRAKLHVTPKTDVKYSSQHASPIDMLQLDSR